MSTDAEGFLVSLHEASRRIEALTADLASARADALAHAIEAEKLRVVLMNRGQHSHRCAVSPPRGKGDPQQDCDCGLTDALDPAAPGVRTTSGTAPPIPATLPPNDYHLTLPEERAEIARLREDLAAERKHADRLAEALNWCALYWPIGAGAPSISWIVGQVQDEHAERRKK